METAGCLLCGESEGKPLFAKASGSGEEFRLVKCPSCGLRYVSPRPAPEEVSAYYGSEYFTRRTDRGYNNYFSDELKAEITRVFLLNLQDLGFFEFEKSLSPVAKKHALDIGCAAGYFVDFLTRRGWNCLGIDISEACVKAARSQGLRVILGDYLKQSCSEPFDLITLWATVEHLHNPKMFLQKIRRELREGGRLYISTCRAEALFMLLHGKKWRYYNLPEHLYYFTYKQLKYLLKSCGFTVEAYKTYGSGIGKNGSRLRRVFDFAGKHFGFGDMMLVSAL